MLRNIILSSVLVIFMLIGQSLCAMTMKQLEASMATMRAACMPKYKVTVEGLDGFTDGIFPEEKDYKCYTMCIGQMAGTLTKKGEMSISKILAQLDVMIPPEFKDRAKEAVTACKDAQTKFKDMCDKAYALVKCTYNYNPEEFRFP